MTAARGELVAKQLQYVQLLRAFLERQRQRSRAIVADGGLRNESSCKERLDSMPAAAF